MAIKAIIFDIGGVLLENPLIGKFWQSKSGSKELRDKFGAGKIPKEYFIKEASKILGMPEEDFLENYGKAYFPIGKIDRVFDIIKSLKIKSYLFSDTNPIHLKFIKNRYPKMFKLAEKSFMSSDIGSRKNENKSYQYIIKKLKLKPEEILLIDDKQEVLDIAKKHRLKTILFKNNKQLIEDLKKLGVKV